MKAAAKHVQNLEWQVAYFTDLLQQARKDIEFYRGKVERLELAIAQTSTNPAQQVYGALTRLGEGPGPLTPFGEAQQQLKQRTPPPTVTRIPWSEMKARWNGLTAEQQEKALNEGWDVRGTENLKEETSNAGSNE